MKNFSELSMIFYSKNEASIELFFSETDNLIVSEILMYCSFVIRQLQNLSRSNVDVQISEALLKANDSNIKKFNLGDFIKPSDIDIYVPNIVPFRENGEKRFDAILNFVNTKPDPTPMLILNTKGFGIFGREVNYYALQSINLLLKYFSNKYSDNYPYLYAFSDASNLCGREYLSGKITPGKSQGEAAFRICSRIFPKK